MDINFLLNLQVDCRGNVRKKVKGVRKNKCGMLPKAQREQTVFEFEGGKRRHWKNKSDLVRGHSTNLPQLDLKPPNF